MPDPEEKFRQRLAAARVDLSAELIDLVVATAGPLVTALDDLAALALGETEPFSPARRLPDDASR